MFVFFETEYITYVHAPTLISSTKFSSVISLKCRHLREGVKKKEGSSTVSKIKQKQKHLTNKNTVGNQQRSEASKEILIDDMDIDKENTEDTF